MDWDALAARYESQLWLERRPLEVALDLARPTEDQRLLDVGTGTGAALKALARRSPRPRVATGVDSSAAMLARVGALPEGWDVVPADVARLPFADESFDIVVAAYVLHVLDGPARVSAMREMRRVLRPAGVVVTVTPALPLGEDNPLLRWIAAHLESRSGPLRALFPLDPRRLLAAGGFDVVEVRRVWLGYPSLCVRAVRRGASPGSAAGVA